MTPQEQKVMELALEALKRIDLWLKTRYSGIGLVGVELEAIIAIKEALSQPKEPEQEPIAWMWDVNNGAGYSTRGIGFSQTDIPFAKHTPLFTNPPQRTFVGLTDEEKKNIFLKWYGKHWAYTEQVQAVMNSVEAKLKELNT